MDRRTSREEETKDSEDIMPYISILIQIPFKFMDLNVYFVSLL